MAVRPLPPDARARLKRRPTRAIAALVAIAGAACLATGARADPEPAAARARGPAPAIPTAVWSPRRVPGVLVTAVAAARLRRELPAVAAPFASCVLVTDATGTVGAVDPERPLAGASTQKLLVAAAALAVMGARHRFETRAVSDAPLNGGELGGDLTIVGGGDPLLTTSEAPRAAGTPGTRLADLADAIVAAGVRRIDGALVADDSRYDRERAVPDWTPGEAPDAGALGALVVDGGRGDDGLASPAPALRTVQLLATLLSRRGVSIAGGAIDPAHAAPADAREVAHVSSSPLGDIVEEMLTDSNNETADLLTRELGLRHAGAGTTVAGTSAIPAILAASGVPVGGVTLHDGSGLAHDDRVTCRALLGVLALGSRPRFSALVDGLAIAGRSGTLAGQFAGTALAGRLRAKTGHIDGVVGLVGVVPRADAAGRPGGARLRGARFAFLANGDFSTETGELLQDRVATAIAGYVDAAGLSGLVPAPRAGRVRRP